MSSLKIEDLRFSSSSVDDFLSGPRPARIASTGKIRISGLHELAGFQVIADDKLVRLSQQDFWKLGQDGDGTYIERLVDDASGPVKS